MRRPGRRSRARITRVVVACALCACAGETATGPGTDEEETAGLLHASDFVYLGAIRVPAEPAGSSRFGWGGQALAFRPDGDPAGNTDGFPGSLFVGGHPYDQAVSEITIPAPVKSVAGRAQDLPVARFLQPFADVTGGMGASLTGDFRLGGLAWLEAQNGQSSAKLHWTAWRWYNVTADDPPGHGWSDVDLAQPRPHGGWRLRGFHNQMTAGYVFTVPDTWAHQHFAGRRLISGLNGVPGAATSSWGPSMFAYAPWQAGAEGPPAGAALDALALVYYPATPSGPRHFPDHNLADSWGGGAWITAARKHAVIIVGRKSLGPERYGIGEPGDCNTWKGYHGEPYDPRMLFYDPARLDAAARGEEEPWDVLPYEHWSLQNIVFPVCDGLLTGAAYDRSNRLLYLLQPYADAVSNSWEPQPLIHVFRVNG
jgi:hypothetical protein